LKAKVEKIYVPSESMDSTRHLDLSLARRATFPNLKPSTETISLRLPKSMLNEIKLIANKQDVPYQSLIKMILAEKLTKV
jgi:predicted DNA binding CopG/RHH family protein